MFTSVLRRSPLGLTALRALLAPVVVLLAVGAPSPPGFGICLLLAFLSDVFDGVIARRFNVATPSLRRLDSAADSVFYLAIGFATWRLYPQIVRDHSLSLVFLILLEFARYALDYAKFRRESSYHMWSSKLWGLLLFLGFFRLLALGRPGAWLSLAIYVGIIADLEGVGISILLKHWQVDVPTLFHAARMRLVLAARREPCFESENRT
ncbi:MAG: CDP-alcohol phosphatidyltransferase family protein [Burkholderiaceae bacterium]|jgi:CDP-diacylglycerol--glycerol-3-phosphate 3-phosphatidyltransferase